MSRNDKFGRKIVLVLVLCSGGFSAGRSQERFTIDGKQLLLDGKPFKIKAIGYQPLQPGENILSPLDEARIRKDLAMIARSGANTLRAYPQPIPGMDMPLRFPKSFYDLVREFDLWIIRDIYIDGSVPDPFKPGFLESAVSSARAVVDEVFIQGGQDRILAWEIGNEFTPDKIRCANDLEYGCLDPAPTGLDKPFSYQGKYVSVGELQPIQPFEVFLAMLADSIKKIIRDERQSLSTSALVTWASWPPVDPMRSDFWYSQPAPAAFLDFVSYNAYPFWPDRLRSFTTGSVTGTPYQGYLEFLSSLYPETPLMVSEVGYPNSPWAVPDTQAVLSPLDPAYRRGGISHAQMAQALENALLDALLADNVLGTTVFEWCDEWNKIPFTDWEHDKDPEEYFGLLAFDPGIEGLKPAFDAVRRVYATEFPPGSQNLEVSSVTPADSSLDPGDQTEVTALVLNGNGKPLEYLWFASSGTILGSAGQAVYTAPPVSLGPVTITVLVRDPSGQSATGQAQIEILPDGPLLLEVDTCGQHRAGGRAYNFNLATHKLALFIKSDIYWVQPWGDAPHVEVAPDGTWDSYIHNRRDPNIPGDPRPVPVWAALVPRGLSLPLTLTELPPSAIAVATIDAINDEDGVEKSGDLLDDNWETAMGLDPTDPGNGTAGTTWSQGPLGDPDNDGLLNLEEFRLGKHPLQADNDEDGDQLPDNWERRYLGSLAFGSDDDPDGDGLSNAGELAAGTSPARPGHDRDGDGLPDAWEREHFGSLSAGAGGDPDGDGIDNITEYRNLTDPRNPDSDGDGMTDGYEVQGNFQPLLDDAGEDHDGDSRSNLFEFRCFTDPRDEESTGPPCRFIRGDANADHLLDISDVIAILFHNFLGTEVFCQDAVDVDDNGAKEITDAISLLHFLFRGGEAPANPFPDPGLDPTAGDSLDCGSL